MRSPFRTASAILVDLLVLSALTLRVAGQTVRDSHLEIVEYNAPSGWAVTDKPGPIATKVYTSPDSTSARQAVVMLILTPQQERLDFKTVFDAMSKQMTASGKPIQNGDVVSSKSRQGFDALSQNLITELPSGERVYVRMVAVNVNNRMASFVYLASGGALYVKHTPDMDSLLQSVRFNADPGAVANGNMNANALPVARGPATGQIATGVPIRDEAPVLAKLRDQFNAGRDGRRKPHTVLGDVLTLDGKPVPNIISCDIQISGFTIAAERATYTAEPDKSGHYELQIPDGIYRVFITCFVSVQGHHVLADFVSADGKASQPDQSSATGIVQDFRLVLNALKPGSQADKDDSYFGGLLKVGDPTYSPQKGAIVDRHPGFKARFNFVPQTPALDGSSIQPFIVDLDLQHVSGGMRIPRMPIALYHLTASLISDNGQSSIPLTISNRLDQGFGPSADVFWESPDSLTRNITSVYVRD